MSKVELGNSNSLSEMVTLLKILESLFSVPNVFFSSPVFKSISLFPMKKLPS